MYVLVSLNIVSTCILVDQSLNGLMFSFFQEEIGCDDGEEEVVCDECVSTSDAQTNTEGVLRHRQHCTRLNTGATSPSSVHTTAVRRSQTFTPQPQQASYVCKVSAEIWRKIVMGYICESKSCLYTDMRIHWMVNNQPSELCSLQI